MPALEFIDVSKTFRRSTGQLLFRSHLMRWLRPQQKERFFALKNVSFRVERGESLAIIGRNGAGKSTLLSLVAGLAKPDGGTISVNGRIAALLELGSGFHPDLTGTENVFLNAALLGLTRKRTMQLFDAIVEFADIGDFIGEPLRTYSTGMMLRLAFSVAIHMDPDILLIDEVLAVGDQGFQARCLDKVHEFRRTGKTIVCVSHASAIIQQFCDRAIWLDHGELLMKGPVLEVSEAYGGRRSAAT